SAFAAEAARKQGKFWPFHDELFAADLHKGANLFSSLAEASGIDLQRFEAERLEEATRAKVGSDIELGVRLKIGATPNLFLNRRRVSDASPPAMRVLINHVLQGSSHQ